MSPKENIQNCISSWLLFIQCFYLKYDMLKISKANCFLQRFMCRFGLRFSHFHEYWNTQMLNKLIFYSALESNVFRCVSWWILQTWASYSRWIDENVINKENERDVERWNKCEKKKLVSLKCFCLLSHDPLEYISIQYVYEIQKGDIETKSQSKHKQ